MIAKTYHETDDGTLARISFTLPESLWADTICLVGDFNGWNPTTHPFARTRDGGWALTVVVPAGRRYAFYYLCDSAWMCESHADSFTCAANGAACFVVDADPRAAVSKPIATPIPVTAPTPSAAGPAT
jgi:1,4-alpha-glucan branching enzyme